MAKLTEQELEALRAAPTEQDYNDLARNIKKMHGNAYPSDWYAQVLAPGGIADELKAKWGNPKAFDIHVSSPGGTGGKL